MYVVVDFYMDGLQYKTLNWISCGAPCQLHKVLKLYYTISHHRRRGHLTKFEGHFPRTPKPFKSPQNSSSSPSHQPYNITQTLLIFRNH